MTWRAVLRQPRAGGSAPPGAPLRLFDQGDVALVRQRPRRAAVLERGRVARLAIDGVGLRAQVREHLVALARRALVAERGDVDGRDHDALAGTGGGLGEQAAVEVHDLAPPGPGVRG